jgi:adenine deaminase
MGIPDPIDKSTNHSLTFTHPLVDKLRAQQSNTNRNPDLRLMSSFRISGKLIDIHDRRIVPANIVVENGIVAAIEATADAPDRFICPGFIDAHVHIESSMLPPSEFARLAVPHGTVATVSDPHEIANVCGIAGVEWMIANAKTTPLKVHFGAPSCVPATGFETAGATLDAAAVDTLLGLPDIWYLSEMMNYPGVLNGDAEVLAKIEAAKRQGLPVDGHAPGLRGVLAAQYAAAGISTDHECSTLPEALDKIDAGMQILIREGSAARNYEALHPLLAQAPERVMFCSDDKHPDDLVLGHINSLVTHSLQLGYDLFDVLRAASLNPVVHYKLPVGLLRIGDPADFIVVPDLESWKPESVFIGGVLVAEHGKARFDAPLPEPINQFECDPVSAVDLIVAGSGESAEVRIILAEDGQLLTGEGHAQLRIEAGVIQADVAGDVLKIVVVNRYQRGIPPAVAFISGFGLRTGAIASTVAHDCHNIIAVGADDESIARAINAIVAARGGIAVTDGSGRSDVLPLPVAGLISLEGGAPTAAAYSRLSASAKALGSGLQAPFMTLSFMALLVIPSLKLSDRGLFSAEGFDFVPVVKG